MKVCNLSGISQILATLHVTHTKGHQSECHGATAHYTSVLSASVNILPQQKSGSFQQPCVSGDQVGFCLLVSTAQAFQEHIATGIKAALLPWKPVNDLSAGFYPHAQLTS